MKKENFTPNTKTSIGKFIKTGFLSALLLFGLYGTASAQCPLGCNNSVQISLDEDCSVEITPDMVLEGQGTNGCAYTVQVLGSNNQPIPGSPVVGAQYVGETLTVQVSLGANSCWGTITIEDKLPPEIDCPDDEVVSCYQSVTPTQPSATDNCDGSIPVTVISDETVDLDCTNQYSAQRTIIYQAIDDSGNESGFCTQNIFFERIDLDDIVFPTNKDDVEDPALECDNIPFWDTNGNGYPDPDETGTPTTADGFNIFPNNSYCELNATFTDQELPICEASFKVLRTWTVLDWCTGEIREDFQILKVVDKEKPLVTAFPDNFSVPSDPYDCSADWDVPAPIVIFDCSSTSYTVQYLLADNDGNPPANGIYIDDEVVPNGDGFTINNLPLGRTWVRYTITDACGNVEFAFTEIDVIDDVPPVPVCDEFTVATLTNSGTAHIFAQTFDDGSHDNCSDVSFEVRRMTSGCGASTSQWAEYAEFCCQDIGNEIMVELRVTDENGNSNTCMVSVNVQDKLDPEITCPANITVSCGTDYEDFSITGDATAEDNCGSVSITHSDSGSLDDCGEGTIFRRFTATDAGGRSVSCTQRITVEDDTPFTGSSINWPSNRNLTGCTGVDTDPSNTGTPSYSDDGCSLVADTYEDQTFTFVDGACLKILRTWTVIDWCTFDQNNPSAGGIWQYTQVIKVNNNQAPQFSGCSNRTIEAFGEDCNGFAELIGMATDDCTPDEDIQYTYAIDAFDNGTVDFFGNTNDGSGTYPVGLHRITFTAEDQCGNQSTCSYTFNVVDRKKPTPYCLSEITTVIMPSSGEIDIWASDFDLGSFDNCPGDVLISFSSDTDDTQAFFTCDDLGMNELEIWVTDASGNQDFCTTTVNIQSNGGCNGSRIAGDVITAAESNVEGVEVTLQNMTTNETYAYMTPTSGHYKFLDMPGSTDYVVKAKKDDNHRNGVSTLDLVLIQRHILSLQEFEDPYKVIASDINNNGKVNASDLLSLRKLILGIWDELPNNKSWRFVNASQELTVEDAFPFTENISILNFIEQDMGNDFVAVKIGDVNGSATANFDQQESTVRSSNTLALSVANVDYTEGTEIQVPVTARDFEDYIGFQFTLEMNDIELIDIQSGALNVTMDNVATFAKEQAATLSWNAAEGLTISDDEVLFTMTLRAKANNNLENVLDLNSAITAAEAYTSSLEQANIALEVRNDNGISTEGIGFEVYQNAPNPFDGLTNIALTLPEDGNVSLRVFDITGKTLLMNTQFMTKGANKVTLNAAELGAKGILYYQIEFNGKVATKKMISM